MASLSLISAPLERPGTSCRAANARRRSPPPPGPTSSTYPVREILDDQPRHPAAGPVSSVPGNGPTRRRSGVPGNGPTRRRSGVLGNGPTRRPPVSLPRMPRDTAAGEGQSTSAHFKTGAISPSAVGRGAARAGLFASGGEVPHVRPGPGTGLNRYPRSATLSQTEEHREDSYAEDSPALKLAATNPDPDAALNLLDRLDNMK
ncbi:uncharacterized protein LOC127579492 [Pristis pectinata]|uniref:uncharacterized protein LOC127579492 n=1 Tax=Pristis pectinata TaxID=685728 RepID=UPI00223D2138|nr:uncharacterized protein LOC127579492 [Pristis pectinata]